MKTLFSFCYNFCSYSCLTGMFQMKNGPLTGYGTGCYACWGCGRIYCVLTSFVSGFLEILLDLLKKLEAGFVLTSSSFEGCFSFSFFFFFYIFLLLALAEKVEYWLSPRLKSSPASSGFFLACCTFFIDFSCKALILASITFRSSSFFTFYILISQSIFSAFCLMMRSCSWTSIYRCFLSFLYLSSRSAQHNIYPALPTILCTPLCAQLQALSPLTSFMAWLLPVFASFTLTLAFLLRRQNGPSYSSASELSFCSWKELPSPRD